MGNGYNGGRLEQGATRGKQRKRKLVNFNKRLLNNSNC